LRILDTRVSVIAPPDEVEDSFESVAREQTRITTERQPLPQAEAAARRRMMLAEVYRIGQTAEATSHSKRVAAKQEAERFSARLHQYQTASKDNPDYLHQLWQEERAKLFAKLKNAAKSIFSTVA
jgi:regulator of protease activity HflC (stomatin/prohibitin superfamily)